MIEVTLRGKIALTNGRAIDFLMKHEHHTGNDCVLWPFSCNPINGYAQLGIARKPHAGHRVMCELRHGPRPTSEHQAAHSCHQRACINPMHLSWKTHSENMLDKRENGTQNRSWWGTRGKLTPEQVRQIRALEGKATQNVIAGMFGITESNVRCILTRKTWRNVA